MIRIIFLIESLISSLLIGLLKMDRIQELWIPVLSFVAIFYGLHALYFIFIYIISLFIGKKNEYENQNKLINSFVLNTMEFLMNIAHVSVKTSGLDKIPQDKKYMLVYNHTSNFDPIVQSVLLKKHNLIHISKPENFKIPIAGNFVKRNCYLALNRENNREGLKTIVKASKFIKEQKYSVSISPEGTRNKGDVNTMLPFRDGSFKLGQFAQCDIVVVEMYNLRKIAKNFPFKATKVEMNVLDVLKYEDFKDKKTFEISDQVRTLIQNKINSRLGETK